MNISVNLADIINDVLQQTRLQLDPIIGQLIAAVIIVAVALIIGWIVYTIFERVFLVLAKKTKTTLDDEIIKNVKRPIYFLVILIGCWTAVNQLIFLDVLRIYIDFIFLSFEVLLIAYIITRIINVFLAWYMERKAKKEEKPMSTSIFIVFKRLLHMVIYIFAFLVILYLGKIDLSGAIVGLGVSGIAIAFALQSVLGDAFSAFSIYFDHPFEIGDYIVVGEYGGIVTRVTMKSTRIQLLQGEELVISNRTILDRSVRNFKKLQKRRIVFSLGVTYDTPVAKLKKIPDILKKIILNCELTEISRIHFKEFGPYRLNFEIAYYVNAAEYIKYMDIQHKINLEIKEAFEKEGIEFAYPTQTLFIAKEDEKLT